MACPDASPSARARACSLYGDAARLRRPPPCPPRARPSRSTGRVLAPVSLALARSRYSRAGRPCSLGRRAHVPAAEFVRAPGRRVGRRARTRRWAGHGAPTSVARLRRPWRTWGRPPPLDQSRSSRAGLSRSPSHGARALAALAHPTAVLACRLRSSRWRQGAAPVAVLERHEQSVRPLPLLWIWIGRVLLRLLPTSTTAIPSSTLSLPLPLYRNHTPSLFPLTPPPRSPNPRQRLFPLQHPVAALGDPSGCMDAKKTVAARRKGGGHGEAAAAAVLFPFQQAMMAALPGPARPAPSAMSQIMMEPLTSPQAVAAHCDFDSIDPASFRGPSKNKARKTKTTESSVVPYEDEAPATSMSFPPSQSWRLQVRKRESILPLLLEHQRGIKRSWSTSGSPSQGFDVSISSASAIPTPSSSSKAATGGSMQGHGSVMPSGVGGSGLGPSIVGVGGSVAGGSGVGGTQVQPEPLQGQQGDNTANAIIVQDKENGQHCAKRENKCTLDVWQYFTKRKEIIEENGRTCEQLWGHCNFIGCRRKYRAKSNYETTRFWAHLKSTHSVVKGQQQLKVETDHGNDLTVVEPYRYDEETSLKKFYMPIVMHEYTFNIADHEYFVEFIKSLCPSFPIKSHVTIRK